MLIWLRLEVFDGVVKLFFHGKQIHTFLYIFVPFQNILSMNDNYLDLNGIHFIHAQQWVIHSWMFDIRTAGNHDHHILVEVVLCNIAVMCVPYIGPKVPLKPFLVYCDQILLYS